MQILTQFQQLQLKRLIAKHGNMSSSDCLNLALFAEEIAQQCGPFNPARSHFQEESKTLFQLAVLQELSGK